MRAETKAAPLHRVELTDFQASRFGVIFGLIDVDRSGQIEMAELASFMASLGHRVPVEQLRAEAHGDADGDGTLSRREFLEFVRKMIVSDLPEPFVAAVRAAHAKQAAATLGGAVCRRHVPKLLHSLGIALPRNAASAELIDVMDTDGSGDVTVAELLVGAGMLRREQLAMAALRGVFDRLCSDATGRVLELSAGFLSQQLKIPLETAEDIVFLADIDRFSDDGASQAAGGAEQTICVMEFYRLIQGWA